MLRDVVAVEHLDGHHLRLTFDDGVAGEVALAKLLDFDGVFEPLSDPAEVARVRVDADLGTIVWPNGADIDPIVLSGLVTGRALELLHRPA